MKYELFRDDDIGVTSNIILLRQVHELFLKYNKIHTVAVLMKDIWENKEVWYWLMTAKNLEVGLHGWDHKNYGSLSVDVCSDDIALSLDYWKSRTRRGKYPPIPIRKFFPPWNLVCDSLIDACKFFNLQIDARVGPPVYNFHYWACQDPSYMNKLEEALKA